MNIELIATGSCLNSELDNVWDVCQLSPRFIFSFIIFDEKLFKG